METAWNMAPCIKDAQHMVSSTVCVVDREAVHEHLDVEHILPKHTHWPGVSATHCINTRTEHRPMARLDHPLKKEVMGRIKAGIIQENTVATLLIPIFIPSEISLYLIFPRKKFSNHKKRLIFIFLGNFCVNNITDLVITKKLGFILNSLIFCNGLFFV